MIIKQYKVVSEIATPVNPYKKPDPYNGYYDELGKFMEFEYFAEKNQFFTNAQDGVYDADCFGETIKQCRHLHCDWQDGEPSFEIPNVGWITRLFLPFNPIPKIPSPEKGVKTAYQFSQLPWYEQIKYIPVAGALCSNGFQELTDKQLETYKNSKVTAAIRYKLQPANNDYAVKESNLQDATQIINQMVEIMPFTIAPEVHNYIYDAMNIFATHQKNQTIKVIIDKINELKLDQSESDDAVYTGILNIKIDAIETLLKTLKP